MKFLFIAPRFHTNQFPIVKSLIANKHLVEILVQNFGKSEDHSIVKPILMKKSIFSAVIFKFIDLKYKAIMAENMKMRFFIPAPIELFMRITRNRPDVVILRNRNLTSMCAYFICRLKKIKAIIIYNQTPLYSPYISESRNFVKDSIRNIIRKFIFPKVRITPVYAQNISILRNNKDKYYIKEHDYFVPFIAEVSGEVINREYCRDGMINILDVGKYRDYKNHYVLVDAIDLLSDKCDLNVTIIGQVVNEEEEKYYDTLKEYIVKKNLETIIKLEKNIEYNKMNQLYLNNDIFVLTSKVEVASISVLEAMANGMVSISTDANGTASYIKDEECGYLFRTMDAKDLATKINQIISKKEYLWSMGNSAFNNIANNYSFQNYYSALGEVLKREFEITLK